MGKKIRRFLLMRMEDVYALVAFFAFLILTPTILLLTVLDEIIYWVGARHGKKET